MKNSIIFIIIIFLIISAVWYFMLKYTADTATSDSATFRQIQQEEVDTQRKKFEQQIDNLKNIAKDSNRGFGE